MAWFRPDCGRNSSNNIRKCIFDKKLVHRASQFVRLNWISEQSFQHQVYHESKDNDTFWRASLPIQKTVGSNCLFQVRNLFVPDDEAEKDRYAGAIGKSLGAGFLDYLWLISRRSDSHGLLEFVVVVGCTC